MVSIIIAGTTRGMRYAHAQNLIHHDFRPANILLDRACHPRICDSGSTRVDSAGTQTQGVGTPLHMAPEMCDNVAYTNKVDVLSLGATLFRARMFSGRPAAVARMCLGGIRPSLDAAEDPGCAACTRGSSTSSGGAGIGMPMYARLSRGPPGSGAGSLDNRT